MHFQRLFSHGYVVKVTPKKGKATNLKATITVKNPALSLKAANEVAVGATEQITATVKPADTKVTFTSSDETIAKVDEKGVVTGVKAGDVTITAKAGKTTKTVNVIVGVVHWECDTLYVHEAGKSCPTEILETLASYNVEGRPIWKPMHMQPIYRMNPFVTRQGSGRAQTNAYIQGEAVDVGMDIFNRGLCLPSDIKMTPEQQDIVIATIRSCFDV